MQCLYFLLFMVGCKLNDLLRRQRVWVIRWLTTLLSNQDDTWLEEGHNAVGWDQDTYFLLTGAQIFPYLGGSLKTAASDCSVSPLPHPWPCLFWRRTKKFREKSKLRIHYIKNPCDRKSTLQILIRYIIIKRKKSSFPI